MSIEVTINGIQRLVNVVSNNINGTWRESYNRNTYKIYLYRYGEHYDTLTVAKGASVNLPIVGLVQEDDDAHIGWTETAGATSSDYPTNTSITPTKNMILHAVYRYNSYATYTTVNGNSTVTAIYDGEITVEASKTTVTLSSGISTGQKTVGVPLSNSSDVTASVNGEYITASAGTNSTIVTKSVSQGDAIVITVSSGSNDIVNGSGTIVSYSCSLKYPSGISGEYRSSMFNYTISLYNENETSPYATTEVPQGYTYTLPTATSNDGKNRMFKYWTTSDGSSNYNAENAIKPTSDIALYATYYDYSYLQTDGAGYFVLSGCKRVTRSGHSNSTGPIKPTTASGSYEVILTFTDSTIKTITLGDSNGSTTVQFDSSMGVVKVDVPEGSTVVTDNGYSSSDYEYIVTNVITDYECKIYRYIN